MKRQFNRLKSSSLFISLAFTAVLISLIGIVSIYNDQTIKSNAEIKNQSREIVQITQGILDNIKNLDLGVRGYALVREDAILAPVHHGIKRNKQSFRSLDSLLRLQQYDVTSLRKLQRTVTEYELLILQMADLLKNNDMDGFVAILRQDKGYGVWLVYKDFTDKLFAYENNLDVQASLAYASAMYWNIVAQVMLMIISLPTLGFAIYHIRKDERQQRSVFQELERNNRQYLFDPGTSAETTDTQNPIDASIRNFQEAVHFIQQISAGNYAVTWNGLDAQNAERNRNTLAGELVTMREQMKQAKDDDAKRQWSSEGVTQFTEIVRSYQHNLQLLSQQAVAFLVKYLHAQQGSLFLYRNENGESYLELIACYAFDRQKHITKKIAIGQGLVGQTYLEAETVFLTQIPQKYTQITSGLGDATPTSLLIVPMKNNETVVAIAELAGFVRYEPHQIALVEKIGEIMATSLIAAQSNERTQQLLEQSRIQAEQMQVQEEEMRQTMEEMSATQEELHRREQELRQQLAALDAK